MSLQRMQATKSVNMPAGHRERLARNAGNAQAGADAAARAPVGTAQRGGQHGLQRQRVVARQGN